MKTARVKTDVFEHGARCHSEKLADERAHRIATAAAEELVRSEGIPTDRQDELAIPPDQADDHMRERISHLAWHGLAVSRDLDHGWVMVRLGSFDE